MVAIIWGVDNGSFFVPFGVLTFWRPFARFLFYRKQSKDTFEKLAQFQDQSPACQEVQQIVKEWQQYISESFYKCDNQILLYLGQLYISDERFSNYINGFSNGNLASFFSEAINIFCAKNKE